MAPGPPWGRSDCPRKLWENQGATDSSQEIPIIPKDQGKAGGESSTNHFLMAPGDTEVNPESPSAKHLQGPPIQGHSTCLPQQWSSGPLPWMWLQEWAVGQAGTGAEPANSGQFVEVATAVKRSQHSHPRGRKVKLPEPSCHCCSATLNRLSLEAEQDQSRGREAAGKRGCCRFPGTGVTAGSFEGWAVRWSSPSGCGSPQSPSRPRLEEVGCVWSATVSQLSGGGSTALRGSLFLQCKDLFVPFKHESLHCAHGILEHLRLCSWGTCRIEL
ncbi:uncharacterized protein LOC106029134 [Cavia porcellus]|uniref:uncharacterized protein LOC106029134 n=1 Tax=Cavia porcellus TaxID=10141 RepID=UPI000661D3E6|nr:uncharacterized protein LOC106029134 [Cavia porcellus]